MLALTTDPAASTGLALTEVTDPDPAPHQLLVRVAAVSVNPTDLHLVRVAPPGTAAGVEAAGVVVRAARDGSGPGPGTPVLTLGAGGGWAQLRAADVAATGVVPDGVDLAAASTLPVAATSALRALRALGPVLGRRVLVTGATGAVGRFAVQLAHQGGAHVLAGARDSGAAGQLLALGADQLTDGPIYATDPVHGVVESVGGAHLVGAFNRLAAGNCLVLPDPRCRAGGTKLAWTAVVTPLCVPHPGRSLSRHRQPAAGCECGLSAVAL